MSLVSVTNLVKNYGKFRAIDDLDLELDGGRIVGLLGENGCGKTTLLKVLAGGMAERITSTSCPVVSMGAFSRRSTMCRAMAGA